ncbi:MAG: plasmid stability protein y4jJ [Hyphomicrobiaceae bacterium]|nr:plasmid stability protein y4jJ [Hyphomicrobiaceae bacterium]
MADILVRRLDDETKSRLRRRARRHGRSLEAEVREILETAVAYEQPSEPSEPPRGKGLGTLLMKEMRKSPLSPEDWIEFDRSLEEARRGTRPRDVDFGS